MRWQWLLLVVCGIGLYSSSLNLPFVYDDRPTIADNPSVRQLWPLSVPLHPPVWTPVTGRPLANLTFAINYAFGGLDVTGYHAVNLAIHIANALLLVALVRRTLRLPIFGARFGASGDILATAAGLLWLVHPLQTEMVDYVTQRTESLAALFCLAALYGLSRAAAGQRAAAWMGVSILSCAFGVMTKESAAIGPIVMLLYDRAFLSASFAEALEKRWPLYVGVGCSWILLAWLARGNTRIDLGDPSLIAEYAKNQCWAIVRYLRLAVWPDRLVLDYGPLNPVPLSSVVPQALLVAGLFSVTVLIWRRSPSLGFLGAWFFVMLALTSSVVPIASEVAAERRMYLPLLSPVLLLVLATYAIARRGGRDDRSAALITLTIAAILAVPLALRAHSRNGEYASGVSVWQTSVDRWPQARARSGLAHELIAAGRPTEAYAQWRLAIAERPDDPNLRYELAVELDKAGATTEAIEQYAAFVKLRPDIGRVRNLLGLALMSNGRLAEARAELETAVRLQPDDADPYGNLGDLSLKEQRFEEAAGYYRQFLHLRPDNAYALTNLGVALGSMGKVEEAAAAYQQAIKVEPGRAGAHRNLAVALEMLGRHESARQEAALADQLQRGGR